MSKASPGQLIDDALEQLSGRLATTRHLACMRLRANAEEVDQVINDIFVLVAERLLANEQFVANSCSRRELEVLLDTTFRQCMWTIFRRFSREKKRQSKRMIQVDDIATLATISGAESDPVQDASRQEVKELLYICLGKLPTQQKRVIEAMFIEGLTQRQIAEELGTTEPNVSQRKARALKNLRECMRKHEGKINE